MPKVDVALVTCAERPGLDADDEPLARALAERGLATEARVWDEPGADWSAVRLAVLRSTWDYYLRRDEFLAWAERTSAATTLLNPLEVVRWNTHKGYLRALGARGAPVVPTVYVDAGSRPVLGEILAREGWARAVVKPAVSADSFGTVRVATDALAEGQAHVEALAARGDVMIQPYLAAVETYGERCLVFLDGQLSHAVRKRSLFQGGRHAGPEGIAVAPAPDEAETARRVLEVAQGEKLLYARVDLARDDAGTPLLLELELVEPTLFLRSAPGAADRLADALVARLAQRRRGETDPAVVEGSGPVP